MVKKIFTKKLFVGQLYI